MEDFAFEEENAVMRHHHRKRLASVKLSFLTRTYLQHRFWPTWPFNERGIMTFVLGGTSLVAGQTTTAELQGFDQNGSPIAIPAGSTYAYSTDNSAVAAVTLNADGITATVTADAAGTANITGTVTTPDGKTFSDTQAVTVTPVVPVPVLSSVKLAFGS